MQNHQEHEAVIPRPRGNLPKACAAAIAAITTGVVMFASPEKVLVWVALAVLMVALGSLLHAACLLAEELLHHRNTRHRGRVRPVLSACGLGRWVLLAAGSGGLLLHLKGCSPLLEAQRWELLLLAPVYYTLLKALGVLGPSEVEVSEICEERKMNVAHGLAWSFYLGYLKLVLPRLEESIAEFCASHPTSRNLWARGSRKLLILVPLNAKMSHQLKDEDERLQFYDNLPNYEMNMGGVQGRVYKHSVYKVLDENGWTHECVVEYATPVLTLYKMSHESTAGFGETERTQQVLLFYRTLQDILERSLECRNRYRLILLLNETEDDPHFLSKSILKHLNQQEREEIFLNPLPQQEMEPPAEVMSRVPTLMISLESPQPLRDPVEETYE
ncbi:Stimulator of interferon genes protein [Oryzias melastigma]|uniref:Stimulator of interferon genes protein n=1 Tax=Oryzias melastigma TaxID=30732 RepID=A0A834FS35_ORYME|nr:Stimulator of interferon genes protein [Oryzias melastigma]